MDKKEKGFVPGLLPKQPILSEKDNEGNKYILDIIRNCVEIYKPNGELKNKFIGNFSMPQRIAVDMRNNIYIADTLNNRVAKFDMEGKILMDLNNYKNFQLPISSTSDECRLNYPTGITVDSAGFIYVVDMNDTRVQKFSPDGKFIKKWEIKKYSGVMKKPENTEPTANKIIKKVPNKIFQLGEVYAFPNPAKGKQIPKIHIEVGLADKLEIILYNTAGEKIKSEQLAGSGWQIVDGKYAYEYPVDVSNIASGVYIYTIEAEKEGEKRIKATGKIAIIK